MLTTCEEYRLKRQRSMIKFCNHVNLFVNIALQHMREGDRWQVYIPSELGYGLAGSDNIPGYSTLCFDIHLVKVTSNR